MARIEDLPPEWQKQVRNKIADKPVRQGKRGRAGVAPGKMNKLETRFVNEVIKPAMSMGSITDYKFEPLKLKLARATFYTPDFAVVRTNDGAIFLYEVKGHWEDDARVKWKTAAELFPWFVFVAVQRIKGKWVYEYYHKKHEA